jgi:predicted RNA-binding Zn ribbon-like protein
MPVSPSHLTLLGGEICLNFTNTKSRNLADGSYDFFGGYPALLAWGLQLSLLTQSEAETLLELASSQEGEAQDTLVRAIGLREACYTVFAAVVGRQNVPAEPIKTINAAWTEAMNHLKISPDREKFCWKWMGIDHALDSVLWPVAKSAAELLVSENLFRVKRCDGCSWLFLDTTRDARRRWCNMKICGNRAKARRYYERKHLPSE